MKTAKKITLLLMLSLTSIFVFAAIGGKGKKGTITKSNLTIKQSTNNFSLRSGYQFKSGKLLQFQTTTLRFGGLTNSLAIKNNNKNTFTTSKLMSSKLPKVSIQNYAANRMEIKLKLKLN
jgi:hypothetical protein